MSLSPANILQRLQELKLWQENHEELLRKTKNLSNENVTAASDYQTIEGLSDFDSPTNDAQNWEAKAISPTKTFDQLLEEKLAEDPGPANASAKPKKPFLRKGSGLRRYRMTSDARPVKKTTPLRAPDLSVKPKAVWCKTTDEKRTQDDDVSRNEPGDQTLYEKALEKELLIFEALEEKAANSSFCSTNSSVLRLFASTPSKKEEKRVRWDSQSDDEVIESNLEKTDIAEILLRLKSLAETKPTPPTSEDDDKWSTSDTPSSDTSLSSADLEATLKIAKHDKAVGTGEGPEESENNCAICGDKFQKKLTEYEKKIQEVIQDKDRVDQIKKELEQKEKILIRKKKEFEDERAERLFELENEKKKAIKEKQIYQNHVKESQNRPNKREREEISNLKQEVADLKETLKLKESKNGMTQARLRNQIKQLEKENSSLKDEVEKLTKENAKLSATQKLNRRPSETKILHEINKNISKLTQETLKSKKNEDGKIVQKTTATERKETKREDSLLEMLNSKAVDYAEVEEQYENAFGNKSGKTSTTEKNEKTLEDGSKQIRYPNGNEKTVSPDGNFIKMKYFNGDIQETNLLDGTVKYFFSSKSIWQTTFADGFELVEFPDGTKEKRYVDGKHEVILPDDVIQITLPDGSQETIYPDGSRVNVKSNGDKILFLPNGQKEIETNEYKKREYPDGTVKTLYPDGTQETRYSNGRVRIKDRNGTLIVDTQS